MWTTQTNKEAMVFYAQGLTSEGRLCYADRMVHTTKGSAEDIRTQLEIQMRAFKRCERENRCPEFMNTKVTMSGKSGGTKDDLLMSLMIALYFRTETLASSQSVKRARSQGVALD